MELTPVVRKRVGLPEDSVEPFCGEDRESCKSRDSAGGILAIQTSTSLLDDFCCDGVRFNMRHGSKGCEVMTSGKMAPTHQSCDVQRQPSYLCSRNVRIVPVIPEEHSGCLSGDA